jgi:NADPH:quinone reductase-like Zn-dependent oxidoreductase
LTSLLSCTQVLDYTDPRFLSSVAMAKFDVILDCVGGDDYWQARPGAGGGGRYFISHRRLRAGPARAARYYLAMAAI